jgi:hypothetical protein
LTVSLTESEPLPPLYERWVGDFLGGPIPRESKASCHQCAMSGDAGSAPLRTVYYFDSVIKCCTYVPELHNFLVGFILSDADPDTQSGRSTVEKRLKDGIAVTPLGLGQPPVFTLLYNKSEHSFGLSRTLRCPHYLEDGGRCGVWRYRDSTCSTWFCKHVRGEVGQNFWRESLHRLLSTVERDLSRWCVLELGLPGDTLRHLITDSGWTLASGQVTGEALDNKVNQESYELLWGEWRGREAEFFSRCAKLVEPLSWGDVLAICGPDTRAYSELTRQSYARLMSDEIPATLNAGSMQLVQIRHETTRVSTYSGYDPVDVPNIVMELLAYFDGRPTEDALAAIREEHGVELDLDLVRKMVDFALLVPMVRKDSVLR